MSPHADFPSLWNLPANPVFRRHTAARLRPWRVVAWVSVAQLMAGFLWSASALASLQAASGDSAVPDFGSKEWHALWRTTAPAACLAGWLAVLVLQAVLVVLKGTLSVATGVAREAEEGMLEAARLTPLPTWHKTLGLLLGLPVLEVAVACSLLVWAALSAWLGDLPPAMMGRVYLVFATSALFHHAVGLVAGTLIRQKILAGTLSQLLVVFLHFVLPALSQFRIGVLSHLGAEAAVLHEISAGAPAAVRPGSALATASLRHWVDFFQWRVSISGYQWAVTSAALAALLAVLARRWHERPGGLLGRCSALALAGLTLGLTCGELFPGFWRGEGTGGAALGGWFSIELTGLPPSRGTELAWVAGFVTVLTWLMLVLVSAVSGGRSRADGEGWTAATVAALAVLTAGSWLATARQLFTHAPVVGGGPPTTLDALQMLAAFLAPAAVWHGLVQRRGWRAASLAALLVWGLPAMLALLTLLAGADADRWPHWLAGASAPLLPALSAVHTAQEAGRPLPPVLLGSLVVHGLVAAGLLCAPASRK